MHFVLFYEFPPDYLERRAPVRADHLRLAWEAQARGELVLAGPFTDPETKQGSPIAPFATSSPFR